MSTIFVAIIIIAIVIIPAYIFTRLHKRREEKRHETLLALFKKAGVKHGLSFTHHEMLKDKMLGLDADNKTLFLFAFDAAQTETLIDLGDIQACTVNKEYDAISMSDKKDAKVDLILVQIGLRIDFSNNAPSLLISFYNIHVNGIYEMQEMKKKAKEWEGLIAPKVPRKTKQGSEITATRKSYSSPFK